MKPVVFGTILKVVGAATAAVALSLGVAATYAQAATPSPTPAPAASVKHHDPNDRKLVKRAIFESEADVLGITPDQLRADLKKGQKVSELANDKHMTKDQFAAALNANLKPRLEALVANKTITQKHADKIMDRVTKGYIPFWDGIHHHAKAAPTAAPSK